MKRLLIAFLALFILLTVFGLGIMTASADATTPMGCKISVVSPLTQIGKSVSGKFSSNCPTTFSLAVYGAPGPKFDLATVDQQTFEGVEHIDLPGHGKPVTATATIPDCYFQAEAFIGDVIVKLSPSNLYGSRLLGPAVNGGSKSCSPPSTTTTTAKPHATTPTAAPTTTTTVPATDHDTGFVPATTTTTAAPELVSAQELAHTGFPFLKAIAWCAGLIALGLALLTIVGVAFTDPSRRA